MTGLLVAPAGVEPTMGESKSPALPLGDGALSHIILTELSCYVKEKDNVLPNFLKDTLL